jgi:hypothetical protein
MIDQEDGAQVMVGAYLCLLYSFLIETHNLILRYLAFAGLNVHKHVQKKLNILITT